MLRGIRTGPRRILPYVSPLFDDYERRTCLTVRSAQEPDQMFEKSSIHDADEEYLPMNVKMFPSYGTDFDVESQETYESDHTTSGIPIQESLSESCCTLHTSDGSFHGLAYFYLAVLIDLMQVTTMPPPRSWKHENKFIWWTIVLELVTLFVLPLLAVFSEYSPCPMHHRILRQMYLAPLYVSLFGSVIIIMAWRDPLAEA